MPVGKAWAWVVPIWTRWTRGQKRQSLPPPMEDVFCCQGMRLSPLRRWEKLWQPGGASGCSVNPTGQRSSPVCPGRTAAHGSLVDAYCNARPSSTCQLGAGGFMLVLAHSAAIGASMPNRMVFSKRQGNRRSRCGEKPSCHDNNVPDRA
jgi:hypothetical protein